MDVEELKKDSQNRELFSKALEESGLYLEWASPEIQNDKELAGSSLDNALIKKLLKQEGLINEEDEQAINEALEITRKAGEFWGTLSKVLGERLNEENNLS